MQTLLQYAAYFYGMVQGLLYFNNNSNEMIYKAP